MAPPDGERLKLVATGPHAKGIFAFGALAEGFVAVGVNAIGVIAVGLNAVGTVAAVGLNAVGLVSLSAVNSVGIIALSAVNAIGGYGGGWVNDIVNPWLSGLVVLIMLFAAKKTADQGSWAEPELPPLVPLADLQAGNCQSGWCRATLLDVELRAVVVGDADGQQSIRAPAKVRQYASELAAGRRRDVLLRIEVDTALDEAPADYRVPSETALELHADEIRPAPTRPLWPQSAEELRWVIAKSLWVAAPLGLMLTVLIALGSLGWL
ncbi:MAG: hypothetical protein JRI23_24460 [Deltaproteobacteria bacterium]|jgi:hypothetical protein|nr:hypothetical protein [Deltaproteobacteria bacterium]MBW2535159.1 hypothetical protein [Deltaproteobacteria bacterium]